jgi:hypothetical protein
MTQGPKPCPSDLPRANVKELCSLALDQARVPPHEEIFFQKISERREGQSPSLQRANFCVAKICERNIRIKKGMLIYITFHKYKTLSIIEHISGYGV